MTVLDLSSLEEGSLNMARAKSLNKDPTRKYLKVRDKLSIIERIEKGEKQCEIAKSTGLSKSAVTLIKKKQ